MSGAAQRLGWHPFPAPAAINTVEYDGRPACTYCGFCQYNVCHCDAKGATHLNVIPRAEATGLLRIETDARVTRINVDSDGLASGITFIRGGQEWLQPAKVVAVGCFVFENVRLLLLSRSRAFPNGLANNTPAKVGLMAEARLRGTAVTLAAAARSAGVTTAMM